MAYLHYTRKKKKSILFFLVLLERKKKSIFVFFGLHTMKHFIEGGQEDKPKAWAIIQLGVVIFTHSH